MNFKKLIFVLLLIPGLGHAASYRVDLIVFTDKYGAAEASARPPNLSGALDRNDPTLATAGIRMLPGDSFGLNSALAKLKSSGRYQPLLTMAWTQSNPRSERGPSIRLTSADVPTLDGSVALLLGNYLHVDVDLAYNGQLLRERRRIKLDELHYLDSPKLGVLARVTKLKN